MYIENKAININSLFLWKKTIYKKDKFIKP